MNMKVKSDGKKIVQFSDFVAIYKGFFKEENINQFFEFWDYCERVTPERIGSRQSTENISKREKADNAISIKRYEGDELKHLSFEFDDFQKYINGDILELYNKEYPGFGRPVSIQGKIQKTRPGEGYHVWHCEHDPHEPYRVLAWALFLNDIEEGGELEFLHQNMRIKPKRGDFVVWPAHFTHLHRGNPPINDEKYIVTGWYQYVDVEPRER